MYMAMLFSATMPGWVKKLARKHLDNPLMIDLVGEQDEKLAEGIELYALSINATPKRTILSDLITVHDEVILEGPSESTEAKNIGFTGVFSLIFKPLVYEFPCFGAVSYSLREKALELFKKHKVDFLIATDIAARAITKSLNCLFVVFYLVSECNFLCVASCSLGLTLSCISYSYPK